MTLVAPPDTASVLCVIPARGGSKGIPRKNVQDLGGKPLIQHSIESAARARTRMLTIVSTDDAEIARCARENACPVLMRPPELARDETPIEPVLFHALQAMGDNFDQLVLLQPTTPFRSADDIDNAVALLTSSKADSVISIVDVGEKHPARMYHLDGDRLTRLFPEPPGRRRQDLPPVYIRNGAIYACKTATLRTSGSLIGIDIRGFVMPTERSVNIDVPEDLEYARFLHARLSS